MKNAKKTVIIVVVALAILSLGLFTGSKMGATSSWTNEIVTIAGQQINAAGFNKKEELKDKDIAGGIKEALDPKIAEEQAELERLLEEYYQLKLAGLTETPEFKKVETDIEKIRLNAFNRYKAEIDLLFAK